MTDQTNHTTISIENLKIGYQSVSAESSFTRDAINYSAGEGEMIALIGPNGIGKSTLLKTIVGFQKPMAGNILLDHIPLSAFAPRELAKKISYVSTENVQVANMRVADLVAYGRFPYTDWLGHLGDEDVSMVMDSIDMVGLLPLARKMVNQLSDGERQRAMIARALAQDTPLIILDEPTAFLDISNKYGIFHLLHNLVRRRRKTVLLSTHDLNIALKETDKLWIMLDRESLEGAPEDAILHGWLNHLFRDDRIGFDAATGDFYFTKEKAGTAKVFGEGLPYALTVRALERKGYEISDKDSADVSINIVQHQFPEEVFWELSGKEEMFRFSSLYDLLVIL